VHRLSNLLTFTQPGQLQRAEQGKDAWPQPVFEQYWSLARADTFAAPARSGRR
jgi:hypothetical protein